MPKPDPCIATYCVHGLRACIVARCGTLRADVRSVEVVTRADAAQIIRS